MNIARLLQNHKRLIDKKLDEILPKENMPPARLHKAMRYSVFSGGKRIRPILAIESCLCCGGAVKDVMEPACAIELVHTFSLIHDDLPSMDDDNYRRGKPTCHKKFDEATAILTGDSLLALAMEIAARGKNPENEIAAIRELAGSIGSLGMAGGQSIDIEYEGRKKDLKILNYINLYKTAAFIRASLKIGAIVAGARTGRIEAMAKFGGLIGEAFQIIDDILDNGDSVVIFGKEGAYKRAQLLTKTANERLKAFGKDADTLKTIAGYLLDRTL